MRLFVNPLPDRMATQSTPTSSSARAGRRPQARVALALLEALRDLDRPGEVLDDENVTETLPRRLGLSEVVDAQIRRYQQESRLGRRVPSSEVEDLIRLATRRPDAERLFHNVGRSLTSANGAPAWRSALTERLVLRLAQHRIRRRLRTLFGQRFVSVRGGPFRLESVSDLLSETDPGGGACALVTGLAQAVVEAYRPAAGPVTHVDCRARGDACCAWILEDRDDR